MSARILLSALATAAAIVIAAPTAAAQHNPNDAAGASRVIATYEFGAKRHAVAFPMTVIVADSAGSLVASARMAGATQPLPMTVTVIESDLVLEAETKDGVLTLVFDNQAKGGTAKLQDGRWSLGNAEGRLRSRM